MLKLHIVVMNSNEFFSHLLNFYGLLTCLCQSVSLSENDLLACCGFECGYGCEGGYPIRAWQYFKRTGVVTNKVCCCLLFCACQLPLYILNHFSKGCNMNIMLKRSLEHRLTLFQESGLVGLTMFDTPARK